LPPSAFNRLADNWRPLFAIAETAGGDWPRRAADAFTKLTGKEDGDAQGISDAITTAIGAMYAPRTERRMKRLSKLAGVCFQYITPVTT
jgi:hypothetical protein